MASTRMSPRERALRPGVTVIGSVAVDHIDDAPRSPGGCPSFATIALTAFPGPGRIVTRWAARDSALFTDLASTHQPPITVLPSSTTSACGLKYSGDRRLMTIDAIGDEWTLSELRGVAIDTTWVHVAPLVRSDFAVAALRGLAKGHRLAYDGQGLVRAPRVGVMKLDSAYDPAILNVISVLKMAEEEAEVVAGERFGLEAAHRLRVPEIVVTFGAEGCDLYVGGRMRHVPAARRVLDVQSTGAGDVFTVAYVCGRARGDEPLEAARNASRLVAEMLEARRATSGDALAVPLGGQVWPRVPPRRPGR